MAVRKEANALTRVARDPVSRRKFIALSGGGAAAAFLAACGSDDSSTTTTAASAAAGGDAVVEEEFGKGDVGILNYALTLEYLETAFYADVAKSGLFKGSDQATIRKFGSEEAEHVAALTGFVKKLGGKPAPKPKIEFPLKSARRQRLQRRRAPDQVEGSAGGGRLDRPSRGASRGGDPPPERRGTIPCGLRPHARRSRSAEGRRTLHQLAQRSRPSRHGDAGPKRRGDMQGVEALMVTAEPRGGSAQPTSEPIVTVAIPN